jgi:hypothetical protein
MDDSFIAVSPLVDVVVVGPMLRFLDCLSVSGVIPIFNLLSMCRIKHCFIW